MNQIKDSRRNELVVDYDVGLLECSSSTNSQKVGLAGAGTYKDDMPIARSAARLFSKRRVSNVTVLGKEAFHQTP